EDIFFKDLANHRQFVEIYNIFNQLRACEDEINEIYDNWKKEFENHITHLSFEVQLAIEKDEASLEGFVKHWITDCGEYVLKVDFLRDATWRGQPNNAGYGIIGKNKRYLFILGAQNKNVVKNLHRQLADWKVTKAAKKAIDNQKKRLELKSEIRKELESCSHIVKLQDDCKEYLS
ncbi:MAG: hypothetical protein LLG37_09075, partial [Spirochaetia bacterium]|nr:hypothetical protein [Spirochaetia bacterium]